MVDYIDSLYPGPSEADYFIIIALRPYGFATIVSVNYPSMAYIGSIITITVEIRNDGIPDELFSKVVDIDTGGVIDRIINRVRNDRTMIFIHELIMPDKDWHLRIDAGHEEP